MHSANNEHTLYNASACELKLLLLQVESPHIQVREAGVKY